MITVTTTVSEFKGATPIELTFLKTDFIRLEDNYLLISDRSGGFDMFKIDFKDKTQLIEDLNK